MTANFESSLSDATGQGKVAAAGRPALMRSLSEQSGKVVEEVQELGRVAAAGAGRAAATLGRKSSEALEAGVQGARKAKGQLDDLIGVHPMKSVLIALGVGAAIGYLLKRRS